MTFPIDKARIITIILTLILFHSQAFSQQIKKIKLLQANSIEFDKSMGNDANRIKGNAIFSHDNILMYCDSAYLYQDRNDIEAFGNIHINVNDTLDMYSDKLIYTGNTRTARLIDHVKLIDKHTVLTTELLIFDRNENTATYYNKGKISDKDNILVSIKGYYYTNNKKLFFKDSVVLTNPKYTMYSDTLLYNTYTDIATFLGPTNIISKENTIYCENGWYDTKNDISSFSKKSLFHNKDKVLFGDSLYYDRKQGIGKAFRNITLNDTLKKVITCGNYAEYYENQGYSLVTDSAVGIFYDDKDSLFIHADTLKATFDSTQNTKSTFAYHHTRFYRKDIQGICDSLVYNNSDSIITLYKNPVIWSDSNQLFADTIIIKISENEIKRIYFNNLAFIISLDDSMKFNQVKGKKMTGFLQDNKLYKVIVKGNSETIYYVRDENGSLIGINKGVSNDLIIYVNDKKITSITYINNPNATLYPEKDANPAELQLKYFKWLITQRPMSKFDIFRFK